MGIKMRRARARHESSPQVINLKISGGRSKPAFSFYKRFKGESNMLADFKTFIARGNVLDLAVAVILGAAFGSVVKTFTDGIIMPVVGLATGGIDFKSKFFDLSGTMPPNATPEQIESAVKGGKPLIMYGQFINDIITFLIVAIVMFFLVRYAGRLFRSLETATRPTEEVLLLTEIRDVLKGQMHAR
jgi:large conductance mechanosensitive channel